MPRDLPISSLYAPPTIDISRPMSELNWRYVSSQAGLGKDIKVGTDAGKSVQACIAPENPLKGHIARLREEGVKESNMLPMTLSPRVPAPCIGGVPEDRLLAKGARRSTKSSSEDKENDVPSVTGEKKGILTKNGRAQRVFQDIPEEEEPKVQLRRMAPPERKSSGTKLLSKPIPPVSQTVLSLQLRESKEDTNLNRVEPPKSEVNGPSRIPSTSDHGPKRLKRTVAKDNLKEVAHQKRI
jgi:hypothetical protein